MGASYRVWIHWVIAAVVLLLLEDLSFVWAGEGPKQIHLSVSHEEDKVIVFWITDKEPSKGSVVMFGNSKQGLNFTATSNTVKRYSYKGLRMQEGYTSGYINKVVIADLMRGALPLTYYYKCGDPVNGWSEVKTFRTRPTHPDATVVVAITGDTVKPDPSFESFLIAVSHPWATSLIR